MRHHLSENTNCIQTWVPQNFSKLAHEYIAGGWIHTLPLVWQNRPIYKSTSTMATTETIALSYLSPYKPGSPSSTTKGLDSSPTYNQDHTWFNIHATYYIKFTNTSPYIGVQLKLLQTKFKWSSSGSKGSFETNISHHCSNTCQFVITSHKSIIE